MKSNVVLYRKKWFKEREQLVKIGKYRVIKRNRMWVVCV
jgi:hypothetical protein